MAELGVLQAIGALERAIPLRVLRYRLRLGIERSGAPVHDHGRA